MECIREERVQHYTTDRDRDAALGLDVQSAHNYTKSNLYANSNSAKSLLVNLLQIILSPYFAGATCVNGHKDRGTYLRTNTVNSMHAEQ